jgi:hypothetical protein
MIDSWWQSWKMRREERKQLDRLNAALELSPEQRDFRQIYPIILPGELLEGGWPGPIIPLLETPFALGWAEVRKGNIWTYISDEQAGCWDEAGLDWRQTAYQNLKNVSDPGANGEKLDVNGHPFMKGMLQDDAFGPSRLLIPHLFDSELGANYEVAIPERTCAIAFRSTRTPEEESVINRMIGGCFEEGTEPMSSDRYPAASFWKLAEQKGW